ncbi:MAG: DUF835 domain-containing protein [Thermoplasmata archaeon]|nr:DUF835 domain-containing protein [Thermoplasmata archaeon]
MSPETSETTKCPYCGKNIPKDSTICSSCGKELFEEVFLCPKCNEEVGELDEVCPHCGARFASSKPTSFLETGGSYIAEDENLAYRLFKDLLDAGFAGLCLTKSNPRKIRKRYNVNIDEIYWLTSTLTKEKTLDPQRLEFEMTYIIGEFVKNNSKPAIILDAIGLLITANGFEKVIDFVKGVVDMVSVNNGVFIVHVSPIVLSKKEIETLKQYLEVIDYKKAGISEPESMEEEEGEELAEPEETRKESFELIMQKFRLLSSEAEKEETTKKKKVVEEMSIRVKVRDAETGASLDMELEPDNTIDEIIESVGTYWEKNIGVYVLRKGKRILRGETKVEEADIRDGDLMELIPDPEGGI